MMNSLKPEAAFLRSVQADPGDPVGSVLEHCNKASIIISLLVEVLPFNL